ncbi:tRNA (guanosine(46)-N7)-methyltransferase TrmB [Shouchella lehensis]|uniref:tRNA (guanine-N(7)-)-methyltransferase n=2 Tax=Shouchella lehensis TaxID=300825 RepID=A0A060M5F8_9BACI|nr:tRNA (guanosine(46)-N7)-methyltransferase TrmB [Shouchella lehensis]AIC95334.1 tRNA(m7G46)-methyltransferase [Shouchella lehensis G1]MBG9783868.1 tRNA (guanine-N7)-methyltransferase [Shouchella lehensis]RQW21143.1 tRNA (guanosine(46)-N7)-methyltransferase TrmB [Bacillus sp. C1-1]TES51168.1 tRNA (guanosine(46)-N7)-methyltransferase TrmB [Shouchella lehensis]
MRLRHKPWAREELSKRPAIVVQDPTTQKGNWNDLFNNDNPIYVEVGTGKGQFLTKMGMAHPGINFIGVERYESVLLTAMENVEQAGLMNVKLLSEDVGDIEEFFGESEVERVFINFTDPWPKTRHAKRRLTHPYYLEKYRRMLTNNGEIHFKTDNQGLFEYSLHSMSSYGMAFKNVSLDLHKSNMEGNMMTEYEEKFSAKGDRIYRLEATY